MSVVISRNSENRKNRKFDRVSYMWFFLDKMMKHVITTLLFLLLVSSSLNIALAEDIYQEPQAFLQDVFNHKIPKPQMIWITKAKRAVITDILGHKPHSLRIRYWEQNGRTAWILDEIGKEEPITTGIVIKQGQIEQLKVLIFRESRGWEVRYPFFTDQFKGVLLTFDYDLNQHIDGITGATLSVRALKKLARLSLYLHQQSQAGKQ